MTNALYDKGRQAFLEGSIAILTDTIKTVLVKSAYTPNLATHQFLSDVGANTVGTAATLAGKSSTAGVFDANDVTLTAPPAGNTCNYLLIYKDTGVAGTSPLIALIDTATGLPITTNGADVPVTWDNGASRIFKL